MRWGEDTAKKKTRVKKKIWRELVTWEKQQSKYEIEKRGGHSKKKKKKTYER